MKRIPLFPLFVSLILIAIIVLCNPPLAYDDDFFTVVPPLSVTSLCLLLIGIIGGYIILFIARKPLNYSRWGNMLFLLILLVLGNSIAIYLTIKNAKVSTYYCYKNDYWDCWSWDLLPVHRFERFFYFLPIIVGIIFLIISWVKRRLDLFKYGCYLFPILLCLQIVVILYFSSMDRSLSLDFINSQPIPAEYLKYIPKN